MSRRKKYMRGRVYVINDQLLVRIPKSGRRVVATNNDRNNVHLMRITSRYKEDGTEKNVIPIEKYPDVRKASGLERKIFKKTLTKKPIRESQLRKTKTRLNKWDLKKIHDK